MVFYITLMHIEMMIILLELNQEFNVRKSFIELISKFIFVYQNYLIIFYCLI